MSHENRKLIDALCLGMSEATYGQTLFSTRIDREKGIIRGVCVFQEGHISDRNLYADSITLDRLKSLSDVYTNGVKVKADHGSGIFAVSAVLRNFRVERDALRADLHVLDSDENREKLLEMAEEIPDTFGLSVSIEQELEKKGDKMFIRPTAMYSVDLVTEPAACPTGLFSKSVDANPKHKTNMDSNEFKAMCEDLKKNFEALKDEMNSRFKKYDTALWPDGDAKMAGESEARKAPFSKQLENISSELTKTREEFSKKLDEQANHLVSKVAAEFSKVVGTTKVGANPADVTKEEDKKEKPEADFEKRVQANFEKTKSKTQAMSAAIREDKEATGGKGYEAFISSGRPVNYTAKK